MSRNRNRISALLATLALAAGLAACGEKEETVGTSTGSGAGDFAIAGDWSGQLTQRGLDAVPGRGPDRRPGPPSGRTQVAYTGIDCGGEWELDGRGSADALGLRVHRARSPPAPGGACKGSGTSRSPRTTPRRRSSPTSSAAAASQSSGTLTKTDEAGIAPTFAQAGVTLSP